MEDIRKLRDLTGAGIVDCKKALDEANGDLDTAVEIIRKKSGAKAAKKADRDTNEGLIEIIVSSDNKKVSVAKVLCETDFVARNDDFKNFAIEVAKAGFEGGSEAKFNESKEAMIMKIGENLTFGGGDVLEGEYIATYKHSNNKVATVIVFNKAIDAQLGTDLAMQVTAMNPTCISPEEVPSTDKEREENIYREQLMKEGKPAEMIENILKGKINKYYEDVCLLKQGFIKEDKKKVEDVLKEADPEVKILKFVRYSL